MRLDQKPIIPANQRVEDCEKCAQGVLRAVPVQHCEIEPNAASDGPRPHAAMVRRLRRSGRPWNVSASPAGSTFTGPASASQAFPETANQRNEPGGLPLPGTKISRARFPALNSRTVRGSYVSHAPASRRSTATIRRNSGPCPQALSTTMSRAVSRSVAAGSFVAISAMYPCQSSTVAV